MPSFQVPDPASFAPLPDHRLEHWSLFGHWDEKFFPTLVGLELEEVRLDYSRMRLPYRPELNQPAGVMHGGALATLIDTVVVPAIGGAYDEMPFMLTLSMNINYLGAVRGEDAVAHGWVVRRGKSVVFCDVAVLSASGEPAASGSLVYSIRPMR
jgi:uncharacterized protein (TIGR00369 family)